MNFGNSRHYGPFEVRDLSESLDTLVASCYSALSSASSQSVFKSVSAKSVLGHTREPCRCSSPITSPILTGSQSTVGLATVEGVGFSPTRGSNPPLAMSRKSATSAQTKSSAERVKRLALNKRREYHKSYNNDS